MLTAQLGAKIVATLKPIEETGEWVASCSVYVDHRSHVDHELIGPNVFPMWAVARAWAHTQARVRNFRKIGFK